MVIDTKKSSLCETFRTSKMADLKRQVATCQTIFTKQKIQVNIEVNFGKFYCEADCRTVRISVKE